jgi:hypothetical protein
MRRVGYAVLIENDHLAIRHETLLPQLQRGRDNQREALGPITTSPANQAHVILLADEHHAVAVVLDLVDPVGPGGHFVCFGGE